MPTLKERLEAKRQELAEAKEKLATVRALSRRLKQLVENLEAENEAVRLELRFLASGVGRLKEAQHQAENELFTALGEWAGYDDEKDYWISEEVQQWALWRLVDLAGAGAEHLEIPEIPEDQHVDTITAMEKVWALEEARDHGEDGDGSAGLLGTAG